MQSVPCGRRLQIPTNCVPTFWKPPLITFIIPLAWCFGPYLRIAVSSYGIVTCVTLCSSVRCAQLFRKPLWGIICRGICAMILTSSWFGSYSYFFEVVVLHGRFLNVEHETGDEKNSFSFATSSWVIGFSFLYVKPEDARQVCFLHIQTNFANSMFNVTCINIQNDLR